MPELLLVESDPGLAEEVRRAFGPAGFAVVTASAGEQAVERCKSSRPDLILLAAELPDMSGFSVCNRLKRALGSVPLILYTSEATPAAIDAHRATRTHADEYLRKPFDMADLVGRAAQLLSGDSRPAPPAPPTLSRQGREPPRVTPPGVPPVVPRRRPTPAPASPAGTSATAPATTPASTPLPLARVRLQAVKPRAEIADPFADAPRDPAPPRGTPEEKLEFFRERLRARDAFLAKVKEAFTQAKAEVDRVAGELEALRTDLSAERSGREGAERRTEELSAERADLERKLAESESTRQSISDVLSETMKAGEAAEQQWSLRVAAAEEERVRGDALRREEAAQAAEEHTAAAAAFESEKAELRERLRALQSERDELSLEARRLQSQLEGQVVASQELSRQVERDLAAARAELDEARERAEGLAGELADARGRIEALEAELSRRTEDQDRMEAGLKAVRSEAGAYAEKAVASEQAYLAQSAELEAAKRRNQELAAALDEGRASVQGVKGEAARLQEDLGQLTRRVTQATAERDALARQLEAERRTREEAQSAAARSEKEVARLRELESQAGEADRLRREMARAQELLQQRTQQVESSARSAHDAAAERERVRERLELDNVRLQDELARARQQVAAQERHVAELEAEREARATESQKHATEADTQRRARAEDSVELEKRHMGELARLKAALVDMERRLEGVSRAEAQAKRRAAELEKRGAGGSSEELAAVKQRVLALEEELEDLRGENDFLNGEVARYHQKNKDLQAQIEGRKS